VLILVSGFILVSGSGIPWCQGLGYLGVRVWGSVVILVSGLGVRRFGVQCLGFEQEEEGAHGVVVCGEVVGFRV